MKVKWVFVQTTRTDKKTGAIAEKLDVYLVSGEKIIREAGQGLGALQFEEKKKAEGWELENSMEDFWTEQKEKLESKDPKKFKHKLVRMTPKDFKKAYKKDKPKQMSF